MVRNQIVQVNTEEGTKNYLSIPAIKDLMDIYNVGNQRDCLEQVLALHNRLLMET